MSGFRTEAFLAALAVCAAIMLPSDAFGGFNPASAPSNGATLLAASVATPVVTGLPAAGFKRSV